MNKKLKLNKQTISNLSNIEMKAVTAAGTVHKGCWENLWTWYECEVFTAVRRLKKVALRPRANCHCFKPPTEGREA